MSILGALLRVCGRQICKFFAPVYRIFIALLRKEILRKKIRIKIKIKRLRGKRTRLIQVLFAHNRINARR